MIITLCGSARFESWFHLWNEVLTLSGHTVFGLSVYPSTKLGKKNWYTEEEKTLLDKAHLDKIKSSEAIFVLNPFAYLGDSTLKEIEFAKKKRKKLYALESWGEGCGIGSLHVESFRKAALRFGVTTMSPIDTCYPYMKEPWDLLPEAGKLRYSLVDRIDDHDKQIRKIK